MKSKNYKLGFTLIELLAVIVILAIIALIATPMILGVIDKAKLGAAKSSVNGYVDAVEKQTAISQLDQKIIEDGIYSVEELTNKGIEVKGTKPKYGVVTIKEGQATFAKFCMNGYSIKYENNKVEQVKDANFCEGNFNDFVKLTYDGKTITNELNNNTTTFNIDKTNEANWKYISCNKESNVSYNDGIVTVSDINENTECKIGTSLNDMNGINEPTLTNIILLNDSNETGIVINSNIKLDMNGKNIITTDTSKELIHVLSGKQLEILNSNTTSSNINGNKIFENYGKLKINNININATNIIAYNRSSGILNITDSNLESSSVVAINYNLLDVTDSTIHSRGNTALLNEISGTANLVNSQISSNGLNDLAIQSSNGTINVTGGKLSQINDSSEGTWRRSAVRCVYKCKINIKDAIVTSLASSAIYNNDNGTINITNSTMSGDGTQGNAVVRNNQDGVINICGGSIKSNNVNKWDLSVGKLPATINYNNTIQFTDGTNTPKFYAPENTVIKNDSIGCK